MRPSSWAHICGAINYKIPELIAALAHTHTRVPKVIYINVNT